MAIDVARVYSSSSFTSLPIVPRPALISAVTAWMSFAILCPFEVIDFTSSPTSSMIALACCAVSRDRAERFLDVAAQLHDRGVERLDGLARLRHQRREVERLAALDQRALAGATGDLLRADRRSG